MAGSREKDETVLREKKKVKAINEKKKKLEDILQKRQTATKGVWSSIDLTGYFLLLVLVAVTVFTFPTIWDKEVTWVHVWYYGWITAISTGAGVIPFFFFTETAPFWRGVSNAIAGGMMTAASYSLINEGIMFNETSGGVSSSLRTVIGFASGIFFIMLTKRVLEKFEDLQLGDIHGASAQKMVLIIFVMTLHSLTEGIGIGVSFGGRKGMQLGQFISLSLAVHNVPEGLAVALVLTSRKVSKLRSVLWAVFTSLPQPITAIPAFMFVDKFSHMLPSGLGFAAGAMSFVAVFELIPEAIEDSSIGSTAGVAIVAFALMIAIQNILKESTM